MSVLVSKEAPFFKDDNKVFSAVLSDGSITNSFNFKKATQDKYAIVFFYPLDFTFVCPTELIAFNKRINDFQKANVAVFSVSIDSQFSHKAWRDTPINKGGVGPLQYTMVSDVKGEIIRSYDVESAGGVALRGSFLIDKQGIVQHQVVNNLSLGRSIDEILRVVDALQFTEMHGEVCPAGWNKDKEAISPNPEGIATYLSNNADNL